MSLSRKCGERTISEIEDFVTTTYGDRWKDFGTQMADMVPLSHGGNGTSSVLDYFCVLERVGRGTPCLIRLKEEKFWLNCISDMRPWGAVRLWTY